MKNLIRLLALLLMVQISFAQHTNVMISNEYSPNETSICINPLNPMMMVGGANLSSVYYTSDGGLHWTRTSPTSTLGLAGDPAMIYDHTGKAYYFHLSQPFNGDWLDRIVCQRSDDQGVTWNDGAGIGLNGYKDQDKEWPAVNPSNNHLYVTWTQFDSYGHPSPIMYSNILFSKSVDNGITWTSPMRINEVSGNCIDSDTTVEGAVPAIGPAGQIYVSWASADGIMFDRSADDGATWLTHDIKVSTLPGGWDFNIPGIMRCNGMPVTCCDLSQGPHRGTIYINWSDQRNGETDTDIWLSSSTDGGNTWSAPRRVNNDSPGKQQFFTWMTVDQSTGYLWFVFYDRRNYNDNQTDVYMAVSRDGGNTFTNFKVSESPFVPVSNVFFGDYIGVSAVNNVVRPIWMRLENGSLSVWTAIVNPELTSLPDEPEAPFAFDLAYPNPFQGNTFISFKLRRAMYVSLDLCDVTGTRVATLINHDLLPSGKYVQNFESKAPKLSPGVYYFRLTADGFCRTQKVVYSGD